MLDYMFTKKTNLIDDTMQLLSHLNRFDFLDDSEVEADYLAIATAVIKSDTVIISEIIDSLQEDEEIIQSDEYTDEDRAFYMSTLRSLRKLASGDWDD